MMAKPAADLDVPVTKTTGGIVVLPAEHSLIRRHNAPWIHVQRIGRSACDQCRFCTEFCPRFLLGHPIEPHRGHAVARLSPPALTPWSPRSTVANATCAPCSPALKISTPKRSACRTSRWRASADSPSKERPNPSRRIPWPSFAGYPCDASWRGWALASSTIPARSLEHAFAPRKVNILLKQHAGAPAVPVVNTGQRVRVGDLLAAPRTGQTRRAHSCQHRRRRQGKERRSAD